MGKLQSSGAYPQSSSVNEYLMGALPNLINTGGYTPSNQSMSFALNQPKLYAPTNPAQFEGSMNLVGGTVPYGQMNFQPPTTDLSVGGADKGLMRSMMASDANPVKGIAMTDKINTGVGLFNSAVGAISAYKALKLGKENLAFQKDSFNKNFAAMKGTTNAEMEDRQARRVRYDAQNGLNNSLSVADYMAKYGVK